MWKYLRSKADTLAMPNRSKPLNRVERCDRMRENAGQDNVEKTEQWREENGNQKGLKKWFHRDNLIVLVLAGILLFVIALPIEDKKETTSDNYQETQSRGLQGSLSSVESETAVNKTVSEEAVDQYDYVAYLEQRLEKALSGIRGVGRVEVMLTLQSSEELVVEKDSPVARSNTNETDSEGGNRVISQVDSQETTIYRTEGNNSEPYVVKTILPKVEGILVVAQGAGSGDINRNITEIVQALFDVEVHKVKVVPMDSEQ